MIVLKTKWFIYTLIIGLIPFFCKFLIFISLKIKPSNFLFDPLDFIILGLVLSVTNINELESNKKENKTWKTTSIGISIISIVFYAILFSLSSFTNINDTLFDKQVILYISISFSLASAIFGFVVFDRLSKSMVRK